MGTTGEGFRPRAPRAWRVAVVPLAVLALIMVGSTAVGLEPTQAPDAPATSVPAARATTPAPSAPPEPRPAPLAAIPSEPVPTATAPSPPAPADPAPVDVAPAPQEEPVPPVAEPEVEPVAEPEIAATLTGAGLVLGLIDRPADEAAYREPGAPLTGALPFQSVRVNALVLNPAAEAISWTPQVEFRRAGEEGFWVVPTQVEPGIPFHTTHEWVAVDGGTDPGPESSALTQARQSVPDGFTRATGRRASGPNPDLARELAPGIAVEQEFTLKIGLHVDFGATYAVRITNAGEPIPGLAEGQIVLAPAPTLNVERPASAPTVNRSRMHAAAISSVHQPFSAGGGNCATCHATHTAQSVNLIKAETQAAQCNTCHGPAGLGGPADVAAQFGGAPANDVESRSFYSHDLSLAGHTTAKAEVGSGITTRHSQCSDCHNPHNLSTARSVYDAATSTWQLSGSYGTSGVQPVWGAAGETPSYQPLDGTTLQVTAEQQVCYKCHSGFAAQLENDPERPSRDRTDVAKAFNPANLSFHPVEAPGRNQTAKMAESLSGPSEYRMWNLQTTDTVRCTMCHTNGATPAGTDASASLPVHASQNRAILVRPYENRQLPARGEYRRTANFALCLTCHAETPYTTQRGAGAQYGTNFDWHGRHVSGLSLYGSGGTDIDVAGAGQGNALCAECHFRTHGTTDSAPGQNVSGEGIVNFAPNVQRSRMVTSAPVPTYVRTDVGGNCTLTCHGKDHQGTGYVRPAG